VDYLDRTLLPEFLTRYLGDGGKLEFTLKLKDESGKVTGTLTSSNGRETEITLDDREMHLSWVSIVQQATSLVVLSRRAQNAVAAIAKPPLPIQIQIEILGNPNALIARCGHRSCVSPSPICQLPVFNSRRL